MKNFQVSFAKPNDRDEAQLTIQFSSPDGILNQFQVSNGSFYTAQEYLDFIEGKSDRLTFQHVTTTTTTTTTSISHLKTVGQIIFEVANSNSLSTVIVPVDRCREMFQEIAHQRSMIKNKELPSIIQQQCIEIFFEGDPHPHQNRMFMYYVDRDMTNPGTKGIRLGQFNLTHIEALRRMAAGESVVLETPALEIKKVPLMHHYSTLRDFNEGQKAIVLSRTPGTYGDDTTTAIHSPCIFTKIDILYLAQTYWTDGKFFYIGTAPKDPRFDAPQQAFDQEMCAQFFLDLVAHLENTK